VTLPRSEVGAAAQNPFAPTCKRRELPCSQRVRVLFSAVLRARRPRFELIRTDWVAPSRSRVTPHGKRSNLEQAQVAAERGQAILAWQRYEVLNSLAQGDWVALEVLWTAELRRKRSTDPM
jgi:hypothetical protein